MLPTYSIPADAMGVLYESIIIELFVTAVVFTVAEPLDKVAVPAMLAAPVATTVNF